MMNARIRCGIFCGLLFLPALLNAQTRDLRGERLVLDDNGGGGTVNTLVVLPASLGQNTTLTIPDPGSGTAQLLLAPAGSAGAWLRGGNAGTVPGTDYLGTSTATDFVIGTQGSERIRVESDGDVGIGLPAPTARLDVMQSGSQPALRARGGSVLFDGGTGGTPATGAGARMMWIPAKGAFRAGYVPGAEWNDTNVGTYSVGLGYGAQASGLYSVSLSGIATGQESIALGYATSSGTSSVAIGGNNTTASGFIAVSIGSGNTASGGYSTAIGRENTAAGIYGTVLGGYGMTLDASAARSFGFLGGNSGSNPMTVSTPDVAVFGNTDLWLANNDNGASALRFYEANGTTGAFPGSANYSAFRAGAQSADIVYILPTTAPATGQVLSASSVAAGPPVAVTLAWTNPAVTGTEGGGGLPTAMAAPTGKENAGESIERRIDALLQLIEAQRGEMAAMRTEYQARIDALERRLDAPAPATRLQTDPRAAGTRDRSAE